MEYDPSLSVAEDPEVYPPSEDSILLIESLDIRRGEKVLEIGCGSGVVSIHCAANGAEVTSVDINPRAVELTGLHRLVVDLKAFLVLRDLRRRDEGRLIQ